MQFLSRRSFVLSSAAFVLAGCSSYTGDNRSLVPLPGNAESRLQTIGSSPADPMLVRIFKESSELEVWKRTKDATYVLFKLYNICRWSGVLGPKLQEGDRQAPEGFYSVTPGMLNPKSALYLSFNTGFPNKYDRAYGRTGTNLMVHGGCSSAGCYAITDDEIKEIYALAREGFAAGNASFQLQMFPFRMTATNIDRFATDANIAFWQNLKEGNDLFEATLRPPAWDVCDLRYVFAAEPAGLAACATPEPPIPAPAPAFV